MEEGRLVRHQHSFDASRHIPMWDSSDPERAPPPLPLNPNPSAPTVRPSASSHIQAAAEALSAKARESITPSPYTSNPIPERSPDRSLMKGAAHRRLQSLQTPSVKDLRSYLDGNRSPERSPERGRAGSITPATKRDSGIDNDIFSSPSRAVTPTPNMRDPRDTSSVRSARPAPRAILGENTPPSATMLALQTIPSKDYSDFGVLSTQITSLTSICTKMQTEMDKLSRRSKDNATDLVSLKEATTSRDEDIRKSLRDLVSSVGNIQPSSNPAAPPSGLFSSSLRGTSTNADFTTPQSNKFTLPRIPSPNSFLDERVGSPNPYSVDGISSVAMLEKIIREMVTKENQDNLLTMLSKLFDKTAEDNGEHSKKMDAMFKEMKAIAAAASQTSRALVTVQDPQAEPRTSGPLTRTTRDIQNLLPGANAEQKTYTSPKAADFVSEEMIKLLKKIKESVTQSGGLLGEVKAQQHDLRGEVLHMGREIARKIDDARKPASGALAIEDGTGKQDIARIVQEGLADLKHCLDEAMRDKRRQSSGTTISRSSVNSQEVYDVVKHTLAQHGIDRMVNQQALATQNTPGLDKEAILNAIKEAYEQYKPDVQVEQYGLERQEILECLREGLEDYKINATESTGMNRVEMMEAIQEAMKNFQPPPPINEANELRDEILMAVRECLDEARPSLAVARSTPLDVDEQDRLIEIIRQVVVDAVKTSGGSANSREIEISQEDLFMAVASALKSTGSPFGRYGEQVVNQLNELVGDMREEFKNYSTANGRDTEQVLDALKDGLESLRGEIELYVDRAQDVTDKDDIIETVRLDLGRLGSDVQTWCAAGPQGDHAVSGTDMLDYIKAEFESLHRALTDRRSIPAPDENAAILGAISDGFESIKADIGSRGLEDLSRGDVDEAMRGEFEQLRDTVLGGSSIHKDEVLDFVRAGFDTIHGKIDGGAFTGSNEEMLREIKDEIEHLRDTIANSMARPSGDADIEGIRELLHEMREEMETTQGAASRELLSNIQNELEHLRDTMGGAVVSASDPSDKAEILEALQSTVDTVQNLANRQPGQVNDELLGVVRGELEMLRSTVTAGFSRSLQTADREDILETIRLGFDDLRSDLVKKIENPEAHMRATGELLDALNDGLDGLRSEVNIGGGKPAVDMTVSYEMLDTLKEGISNIRSDISKIKGGVDDVREISDVEAPVGNAIVLADCDAATPMSRGIAPEPNSLQHNELEKVEVMLAQLQIKVDALDANISDPAFRPSSAEAPENSEIKGDLQGITGLILGMQATVDVLAARGEIDVAGLPKKEDMDAIETLLSNTKACLEQIQVPETASMASKEHLEAVESLMRSTREAVDDLSVRVEDNVANKEQILAVETMVGDLKIAIEDLKAAKPEAEAAIVKSDIDAVGLIALEIKEKVMAINEIVDMPTKTDMEQLTALVHDFRDSHDKLRENYESDVAVTAKAFDDRKQEAEDVISAIGLVKSFLTDVKEELKSKLDISALEATTLSDNFKILEKTVESNFNVMDDMKELLETVNREFERIHGSFDDVKMQQEQKINEGNEQHEAAREAVIAQVCTKLDEKFDAIMSKYDDAQYAAEKQVTGMEEKTAEQQVLLQMTKEVSEELKLSVDTLGTTVTAMEAHFSEIGDKISSDSQTIFTKMEVVTDNLNNLVTREHAQEEHQLTRGEVVKTLDLVNGMSTQANEFHPKFMVTLQELQALVAKHYEHSQKAQETAETHAKVANEQSRSMADEIKSSFSSMPALLPFSQPAIEDSDSKALNDSLIKERLDEVLEGINETKSATAQLERLDQIHQQVMNTAAEVSAFVTSQTRLIEEDHEHKHKEVEEMALLLERRAAEKEHLESSISDLGEEKEGLLALIESLQSERDALATQKSRLAADVAAMQTALAIRQEELDAMDSRAEALERRVLEGIMDQSRLLLMTKAAPKPAINQRMASNISQSTVGQLPSLSTAGQGLSMALKTRPISGGRRTVNNNASARRVMSLTPITHNTPTGAKGFQATNRLDAGLMKRSQSVRTNKMRKVSWSSAPDKPRGPAMIEDKENDTISEVSENESYYRNDEDDDEEQSGSDESGTERGDYTDDGDYTVDGASRRTSSYAGSVIVGGGGDEDGKMILYHGAAPSDSGLGTSEE